MLCDVRQNKKKASDSLQGKKILIKEGQENEGFFLIEQGNAQIVKKSQGDYLILSRLEEGDFIGQLPFLNIGHEPQGAAVYASDDLEVKTLDPGLLNEEYDKFSNTMKNLIENMCTLITHITKMAANADI